MPGADQFRVFVGARRMLLTAHAVDRYVERVKPALSYQAAVAELDRMLRLVEATREGPAWAIGCQDEDEWVVLSDGIAFPVIAGRLVTCLTRGEVGAELRVVRGEERRARSERKSRPGVKKKHGKVERQARLERVRKRAAQG